MSLYLCLLFNFLMLKQISLSFLIVTKECKLTYKYYAYHIPYVRYIH